MIKSRQVFVITKIIILVFLFLTYKNIAYAEVFKLNQNKSKIIYTLSKFNIPFKVKTLNASGQVKLKKGNSPCQFLLEGLYLKAKFTSKMALFRKAINYDKYPFFSFSADTKEAILIKDCTFIDLYGNLTFHGITQKIKVKLKCSSKKDYVSLTGHMKIKMTDFGIKTPRILFIPIDDSIKTKIELYTQL